LDEKFICHSIQYLLGSDMKQLMKILVAYDGSAIADLALSEAIQLAEQFKGSIIVLNVYWGEPASEKTQMLQWAENKLSETFVKYQMMSERSQNPSGCIVRVANDEGADLIAIGNRGRGSAREWMLGSVSRKVIEEAHCPVLMVKLE